MDNTEKSHMGKKLVFLKLGGSLITDKNTPRTARIEVLQRVGIEIKSALEHSGIFLVKNMRPEMVYPARRIGWGSQRSGMMQRPSTNWL